MLKKEDGFLCQGCLTAIPLNQTLFCSRCRARLPENKRICHKDTPYLFGAAAQYEGVVKNLIWQLKYNKKPAAAEPLIKIIEKYLNHLGSIFAGFIVMPIPLHPAKERRRGFNQSLIIARAVAEKLNLELRSDCLIKTKNTPPQMEINDWGKRRENIAGSFQIKNPETAKGKNILLIDDVTTSGSTFQEAVKTLKIAGAKKIIALAVAKAG